MIYETDPIKILVGFENLATRAMIPRYLVGLYGEQVRVETAESLDEMLVMAHDIRPDLTIFDSTYHTAFRDPRSTPPSIRIFASGGLPPHRARDMGADAYAEAPISMEHLAIIIRGFFPRLHPLESTKGQ